MTQKAKKINSGLKKSLRKTGGGPEAELTDATTEKLFNLFHDEPSFSGIQRGLNSAQPLCSGKLVKCLNYHDNGYNFPSLWINVVFFICTANLEISFPANIKIW